MDSLFHLDNQVVLVTGASSGLGAHFATTLANAGARVALCARRAEKLDDVVRRIKDKGGNAAAFPLDVTEMDQVPSSLDQVEAQLGPVNVLVNNAGVALTRPALEIDDADWDLILDTNLKAAWTLSQAFARRVIARKGSGCIVNIASILGIRVSGAVAPYAVSKAALIQMTRSLALEWARYGIRVNALAPGYILTDLNRKFFESEAGQRVVKRIPQRRIGQPGDLDGALLLLASRASEHMTGETIVVDGGHSHASL